MATIFKLSFQCILSLCRRGWSADSPTSFILTLTFRVPCKPNRESVIPVCDPEYPGAGGETAECPDDCKGEKSVGSYLQSALQSSRRRKGKNTHDCDLFNNWTLNLLDLTETSEETHSNMVSRSG